MQSEYPNAQHTGPEQPDERADMLIDEQNNDADLGLPTWIESETGFPAGSYGDDQRLRPDPVKLIAGTEHGSLLGSHAGDLVAFTEFLAGTALDDSDREWFIDAMAKEFVKDPRMSLEQTAQVTNAVAVIGDLEPIERANNRQKALVRSYRTEPIREREGLAETPIMTLLKAHNPALLTATANLVVTADALDYRHQINRLILGLAGQDLADLGHIRAELTEGFGEQPVTMQAELAGSQIRLVILRTWLAHLSQPEMDQLRQRLREVLDTATDLDLVTMQLTFRSLLDAMSLEDEDDE